MKRCNFKEATWFTVTVNEDEMNAVGFGKKSQAEEELDERFQRAIPEELTLEYLERLYESMKEQKEEGWYVDPDELDRIGKMYFDAEVRDFNYEDAFTNGTYACYLPEKVTNINGKKYIPVSLV